MFMPGADSGISLIFGDLRAKEILGSKAQYLHEAECLLSWSSLCHPERGRGTPNLSRRRGIETLRAMRLMRSNLTPSPFP